jgi:uncharacterized protein Veg
MKNIPANIKTNIQYLEKNIQDLDKQLSCILTHNQTKELIKPYKSIFCIKSDKSRGRTNAEIYNYIIERMKQTEGDKEQYTKDFLEKDSQHLIYSIKNRKKTLIQQKRHCK